MLQMSLRTRVAGVALVGLFVVAAVAAAIAGPLRLDAAYVWISSSCFAAIMVPVVALSSRHPFQAFGGANQVTVMRAGILALLAAFLLEPASAAVAAAAVVGAVTAVVLDGVDGLLARRSGMASGYGARFDMETDAATVFVLSLLVWRHDKAGAWVLLGGMMRYLFAVVQWVWPSMRRPLSPTLRARIVAVTHLIGLSVALAPFVPMPFSAAAAAVTLGLLAWSFQVDLARLRKGSSAPAMTPGA